jgi:hypothetical protein
MILSLVLMIRDENTSAFLSTKKSSLRVPFVISEFPPNKLTPVLTRKWRVPFSVNPFRFYFDFLLASSIAQSKSSGGNVSFF